MGNTECYKYLTINKLWILEHALFYWSILEVSIYKILFYSVYQPNCVVGFRHNQIFQKFVNIFINKLSIYLFIQ